MLKYIRINNAAICFTLFGIGSLFIATFVMPLIAVLAGSAPRRRKILAACIKRSWQAFLFIMTILRLIKVEISADGLTELKNLKGTIVAANHPTFIDVIILVSLVPNPICVVKGKLTRNFFIKNIVLNAYINNETPPDVFLNQCKEVLDHGYNLVVFPEGTRTFPGQEIKLQRGTAYIAAESSRGILPIHISTSERILGKNQQWYHVGLRRVLFRLESKAMLNPARLANPQKSGHINAKAITAAIKQSIENPT